MRHRWQLYYCTDSCAAIYYPFNWSFRLSAKQPDFVGQSTGCGAPIPVLFAHAPSWFVLTLGTNKNLSFAVTQRQIMRTRTTENMAMADKLPLLSQEDEMSLNTTSSAVYYRLDHFFTAILALSDAYWRTG